MPFFHVWGLMRTNRARVGWGMRFRTTSDGSVFAWNICNRQKNTHNLFCHVYKINLIHHIFLLFMRNKETGFDPSVSVCSVLQWLVSSVWRHHGVCIQCSLLINHSSSIWKQWLSVASDPLASLKVVLMFLNTAERVFFFTDDGIPAKNTALLFRVNFPQLQFILLSRILSPQDRDKTPESREARADKRKKFPWRSKTAGC